jgi:hypothetical protein
VLIHEVLTLRGLGSIEQGIHKAIPGTVETQRRSSAERVVMSDSGRSKSGAERAATLVLDVTMS